LVGDARTPGPNAYKLASKAVEGPKFFLGLKLENTSTIGVAVNQTRGNPGAGTYSGDFTKIKKREAAFSIKGRHADLKSMAVPGPGTYTTAPMQGSPDKRRNETFRIGTSKRDGLKDDGVPGPGSYKIPCSIAEMPAYT
jgi:hypothetical protein